MPKANNPDDKRGLIAESYKIENISDEEAKAIFLDWAMMDAPDDATGAAERLLELYQEHSEQHPMTRLLRQVRAKGTRGRRGRRPRVNFVN